MGINRRYKFAILTVLVIMSFSCSTKKNTFTRRVYHNVTARYNGYFNGKESLKEGVAQLHNRVDENFNNVLPVFNYGTESDATSINPYMDKAIKKGSVVINRHSMYFKRVEYNNWVDDSYMLIGKSYFYKREYIMANRTFDFVITKYKANDIKYDAMIWLAKSSMQMEDFARSESLLDEVQDKLDKGRAPKKYEKNLSTAYAEFFIMQENYPPAIEHLLKAISIHHRKEFRTRLRFILAQIYHGIGNLPEATKLYTKVIRKNPKYEMLFNARINLAKCYDASSGDSKMIVKQLNKMLRDEKNEEYLDQIYYALAEIDEKNGDLYSMMENLRLSVSSSVSNDFQKAISSLQLAEIYFEEPAYEPAQAYFDTAVQFLPKDYPDFDRIETRSLALNQLVENINIIKMQDSLQILAGMSEKERNAIVDKLIARIVEEERKAKEANKVDTRGLGFISQTNRQYNFENKSGAGWYFYNPTAMSFGYTEFVKKWGKRKIEDNWRLSHKIPVIEFADDGMFDGDSIITDSSLMVSTDPKKKETYMQYIPLTDEKMAISHFKIKEAFFNLGMIYDERFNDVPRSTASYDSLLTRYPGDSIFEVKAWYSLYKIYKEGVYGGREDKYKKLIITNYPESDYAKILTDPDYYKKLEAIKNREKDLYRDVYLAYNDGDFSKVLSLTSGVRRTLKDISILPKMEYLRALAIGHSHSLDSLEALLKDLVSTFPESEVRPLAQNILDNLANAWDSSYTSTGTISGSGTSTSSMALYEYTPDDIHLYILIVDIMATNVSAVKIRISDFNQKFYSLDNLTISNMFLDNTHQMITVSNFEDKKDAMNYFRALSKNNYVFSQLEGVEYSDFVVSVTNYPTFYRDKDVGSYMDFFDEKY